MNRLPQRSIFAQHAKNVTHFSAFSVMFLPTCANESRERVLHCEVAATRGRLRAAAWTGDGVLDNLGPARELTKYWTTAMPAVAAFVRVRVNRFHDAEDLLQEVAADVVAQFAQYDPTRSFTDWALGIAYNKLKQHYRENATTQRVLGNLALSKIAKAMVRMNESSSELADALDRCLQRVDRRSRELIKLRYMNDFSCAEIAAYNSATTNSVRVALYRVRSALLKCVQERLGPVRGRREPA
jgi:RNA polymerase sigma-70 factor (ECF subfamily)